MDVDLGTRRVFVAKCDERKVTQRWKWGFVNETMLVDWSRYGKEIQDETERMEFSRGKLEV